MTCKEGCHQAARGIGLIDCTIACNGPGSCQRHAKLHQRSKRKRLEYLRVGIVESFSAATHGRKGGALGHPDPKARRSMALWVKRPRRLPDSIASTLRKLLRSLLESTDDVFNGCFGHLFLEAPPAQAQSFDLWFQVTAETKNIINALLEVLFTP